MPDQDPSTLSASINDSETLATWARERSLEERNAFVESKLASQALVDIVL